LNDAARALMARELRAQRVARLQERVDHRGAGREFAPPQLVEQRLHLVRQLGHVHEAEGRRAALDGVRAAEDRVQLLVVGGRDVHRIVRQSPTAEQYAASHGYRFDASTSTMVASNAAAPQEMAAVDCSKQSADVILARRAGAKCIGESVAATKPAPTVAAAPQAKDCSQGSFIEREACKRGIGDVSTMIGTAIKK
jgi:hypothetical protein